MTAVVHFLFLRHLESIYTLSSFPTIINHQCDDGPLWLHQIFARVAMCGLKSWSRKCARASKWVLPWCVSLSVELFSRFLSSCAYSLYLCLFLFVDSLACIGPVFGLLFKSSCCCCCLVTSPSLILCYETCPPAGLPSTAMLRYD